MAQQILKVRPRLRPFAFVQAVHYRIPYAFVTPQGLASDNAVFFRPQAFYGALAGEVEAVGTPAHYVAAQGIKGVAEQQQFAGGVDVGALHALGIPSVANFEPFDRR